MKALAWFVQRLEVLLAHMQQYVVVMRLYTLTLSHDLCSLIRVAVEKPGVDIAGVDEPR